MTWNINCIKHINEIKILSFIYMKRVRATVRQRQRPQEWFRGNFSFPSSSFFFSLSPFISSFLHNSWDYFPKKIKIAMLSSGIIQYKSCEILTMMMSVKKSKWLSSLLSWWTRHTFSSFEFIPIEKKFQNWLFAFFHSRACRFDEESWAYTFLIFHNFYSLFVCFVW